MPTASEGRQAVTVSCVRTLTTEDEREQRHAEFVLTIARWGIGRTAILAAHLLTLNERSHVRHVRGELERALLDFQETEGWAGVFAAIGRALREEGR